MPGLFQAGLTSNLETFNVVLNERQSTSSQCELACCTGSLVSIIPFASRGMLLDIHYHHHRTATGFGNCPNLTSAYASRQPTGQYELSTDRTTP